MFKVINRLILIISILIISAFPLSAETIDSISKVEETALLNNLDYKSAVLKVLKAENDLEDLIKLSDSTLSLSGSYTLDRDTSPTLDLSASASLPVIEQLSLGATIDQDLGTELSINVSPLAHSGDIKTSRLDYQLKVAAAEQTAEQIAQSAVESYLNWAVAKADYELKENEIAVKKTLYEDEKVRLKLGESDLDEVREAFKEWSDARADINTAHSTLQSAEIELYGILNIEPGKNQILPPEVESLKEEITRLSEIIPMESLSTSGSYSILSAEIASRTLELQLDNTWIFEPDLSIGASLSMSPDKPTPVISATAGVSLGLDDWNASDIEELKKELEISIQTCNQTIITENLNLQQAITSRETASINYSIAEVSLEQANELLSEAEFLFKTGDYSAAELDETRLEYKEGINSVFSAAAEHYLSLRKLQDYIK